MYILIAVRTSIWAELYWYTLVYVRTPRVRTTFKMLLHICVLVLVGGMHTY